MIQVLANDGIWETIVTPDGCDLKDLLETLQASYPMYDFRLVW